MLLLAADRIAIVDSDEAYLRLISLFLNFEGCHVLPHSYGRGLVPELVAEQPSVIMFDTWLEDREAGWALLEALVDEPRLCGVPVILACSDPAELSARKDLLERHPSLRVLRKPFSLDTLLALIQELRAPGSGAIGDVGLNVSASV